MDKGHGKYLGVDYGDRRTGIAECDISGLLASAITTLEEGGMRNTATRVAAEAKARACVKIIIGMPRNMDGSYGERGNVCAPIVKMLAEGETFDKVITIGPLIMMKFVVEAVKDSKIPCDVSMNPIMIDGTGMCGGCRLTLVKGGERVVKFACVDGPDFNGYEVDFDEAISRGAMYRNFERKKHDEACNLFKKANEE